MPTRSYMWNYADIEQPWNYWLMMIAGLDLFHAEEGSYFYSSLFLHSWTSSVWASACHPLSHFQGTRLNFGVKTSVAQQQILWLTVQTGLYLAHSWASIAVNKVGFRTLDALSLNLNILQNIGTQEITCSDVHWKRMRPIPCLDSHSCMTDRSIQKHHGCNVNDIMAMEQWQLAMSKWSGQTCLYHKCWIITWFCPWCCVSM